MSKTGGEIYVPSQQVCLICLIFKNIPAAAVELSQKNDSAGVWENQNFTLSFTATEDQAGEAFASAFPLSPPVHSALRQLAAGQPINRNQWIINIFKSTH